MSSPHAPLESLSQRLRSALGLRSVAGQMFALLTAVVLLLVAAGMAALLLQARHDSEAKVRERALAVAETLARSPSTLEGLQSADPTASLQPRTEDLRRRTNLAFIVVMSPTGVRYTHPNPALIGHRFSASIGPAVAGRAFTETLTGPSGRTVRAIVPVTRADGSVAGVVAVGVKVREVTRLVNRQLPVLLGGSAAAFALACGGVALVSRRLRLQTRGLGPVEIMRMYEHHDAVLHSVREGVLIVDGDRRVLLANDEARRLLDLPADAHGRHVNDLGLDPSTAELLASGRVATDEVHPAGERLLAVNHRPADWHGRPWGSVATLRDTTELRTLSGKADVARERLKLLYDASLSIGTTLDVRRTAEEVAHVAVPRFADFVTVDLPDSVLRGEEPGGAGAKMRRTAVGAIREDYPLYPVGELINFVPSSPQARGFGSGQPVFEPDLTAAPGVTAQDPERVEKILDYGIHSLITVPLRARGVILGVVNFWRSEKPEPFEDDDLSLAEELVGRAAVCIDNARRYTREHATALALQRSLLPRGLPEQTAVEVAHRYLPSQAGVGGDWFDVIPLSGARVALVVGDVVGHGLHAAATMGRLRTAVQNFSALDMPPDELLAHLDDLVGRLDQAEHEGEGESEDEAPIGDDGSDGIIGATCVYAIYDPVSRRCTMARAGHVPPALVTPDGTVDFPELPAGPPLGLGGLPFETAEFLLPESSQLVLYTNGLVEDRDRDIEISLQQLRDALTHPDRPPQQTCEAVLDALLPARPGDDIALLVARTRALDARHVASWDLAADPAVVSRVRAEVTAQLVDWGLGELEFSTELMISELVTNAIRYGGEPIQLRVIRERVLTCEVSDGSSTSPRLRRARTTDEGGRGLFLVAQLAQRWGTRYTTNGKIIWTEQALPP
ncbi:SpoIIE family protein phosphatase [Streptomyces sp. RPA4-5]|uniref:SpoIIE family protein phosphatase n=1 Tax=Streptomyces sp. RPA4-5 TaxID=2721245 RepID=UPI00143EBC98|nr:SpoIIE family protein phosphatase [Streptomyces sp. RPA4-5]QIY53504.1 SpoIIE family protein phosphatase [Streptomyces sp. RPA4-5]